MSVDPQGREESKAHQDQSASQDLLDQGDPLDSTVNPERLVTWGSRAHLVYR